MDVVKVIVAGGQELVEKGRMYVGLLMGKLSRAFSYTSKLDEKAAQKIPVSIESRRVAKPVMSQAPVAYEDMTPAECFKAAHAIAREIRSTCDSYHTAFTLGLIEVNSRIELALQAA